MSRKFRKAVASTLALAMMAGNVSGMSAVQFSSIVQAAENGATVTVNPVRNNSVDFNALKPGDEFTVTCDITNNSEGFSALVAWMSYNQKAFTMTKWEHGTNDEDSDIYQKVDEPSKKVIYKNPDENIGTIVQIYFDGDLKNFTGDACFSKITFKVNDNAVPGDYSFSLGGDPEPGANGMELAKQNRIVVSNGVRDVIELTPSYKPLSVKVAAKDTPTAEPTVTPTVEPTVTPTVTPTATPTVEPTVTPTVTPTVEPTVTPTVNPTVTPTITPTQNPAVTNAIRIELGTVTGAEPGTTVTVPVYAKNIGNGFSTVQFDYKLSDGLKLERVNKGEISGSWTVGTENTTLQFLEADGNNIVSEGIIGKLRVTVPSDAENGDEFNISISNFEGSYYDKEIDRQLPIESSSFTEVNGKIVVGEAEEKPTEEPTVKPTEEPVVIPTEAPDTTPTAMPTINPTFKPNDTLQAPEQEVSKAELEEGVPGPKLNAGKYEVAGAGSTFDLKINVTDNAEGFNALIAWLDLDTNVFELVDAVGGDTSLGEDNEDSDAYNHLNFNKYKKPNSKDLLTLVHLYDDTRNNAGDIVLSTVTLRIKDGVKDGYYTIPFDAKGDAGRAMANRIVVNENKERVAVVLNPTYYGAVVKVGSFEEPTAPPVTEEPTTPPTTVPTEDPSIGDKIQIELGTVTGAEAGATVSVPVYAKNIGDGFSTVQFDYKLSDGLKLERVNKGDISGSWTAGTENQTLQFLEADGNNIASEGTIGKLRITVPSDAKDGDVFYITASNFEGSVYDKTEDRQMPLDGDKFAGIVGKIVVGEEVAETTPVVTTTEVTETTPVITTPVVSETTPVVTTPVVSETTPVVTTPVVSETTPVVTTTEVTETTPVVTTTVVTETTPVVTTPVVSETTPVVTTPVISETTPVVTTPVISETTPVTTTVIPESTSVLTTTTVISGTTPVVTTPVVSETTPVVTTPVVSETTPVVTTTVISGSTTPVTTTVIPGSTTSVSETKPAVTTTSVSETKPAVTTTAVSETTPAEPQGPIKGDVDDNGVVNTRDLIKLKKYLLLAADKSEVPNGDINGDKTINTIDLIGLVKILLAK